MEEIKANQNSDFGNYIIIDHGGGYYSLLGHLRHESVRVRLGDRVKAGQEAALRRWVPRAARCFPICIIS
jgi:murein DD-endopeptidase MepM/ murein hydrolase activator NlpD